LPLSKAELQDIRSLLTSKGRNAKQEFLAEGVRLLEEALRHQYRPTRVFFGRSLLNDRGEKLLVAFRKARVELCEIPARQLEALADTETPQGIVGQFAVPRLKLDELYRPDTRRLLVCENIGDPGNLGTLIRSALAFDMEAVITFGSSAELYSPKVIRGSAGAAFGMRMIHAHWSDVKRLIKSFGTILVATDLSASQSFDRVRNLAKRRGIMLAVGSEAAGLSDDILRSAEIRVRIKHSPAVDSLNAAVAGSLLMRELYEESNR
jgi:TrmH family RNA methyltransferase